jgi:hypothetical protein
VDVSFDFVGWGRRLESYSWSDISDLCRDVMQKVAGREVNDLMRPQWIRMTPETLKKRASDRDDHELPKEDCRWVRQL